MSPPSTGPALGFESVLWDAADLLRSNLDPAEYKHVVLGLLFLKYVSDAFTERRDELAAAVADPHSEYFVPEAEREAELEMVLEDRDEYTAENVFWVPLEARWEHLKAHAFRPEIGTLVDDAMVAIEDANPQLRGALPKIFARPALDKENLGKLIVRFSELGLGSREHRDTDVLGRVYEYFLGRFASAEGKGGGEFYTPRSVVRLLVEMLEPYEGRVYDPCCGSGGLFVQSLAFIEAHDGRRDQVSVYGQESNPTTWRLARMNLAIRGIEAHLGHKHADTFREDLHPDLRADVVLANPPFNISQWHGEKLRDDVRWRFGAPPVGNANYAWMQHILHHLTATGTAGFVMANGSLSTSTGGEGAIRRKMVEADVVDCIVALPPQLFYQTQIPVSLWFLTKHKGRLERTGRPALRDRTGEVLFIDAREMGTMETRVHRILTGEDDARPGPETDIGRIAATYHAWRNADGDYADVPGFCKSAGRDEIERNRFVLTPGRYVGVATVEREGEPVGEAIQRLIGEVREQLAEAREMDPTIENVLSLLEDA
ncbi:MAG: class I SAM-dependent DNA methyltransferase [Bacteroidota bacterium]